MAKDNRFSKLETSGELPEKVKSAIAKLERFDHLEIGQVKSTPSVKASRVDRLLCPHCGQSNEQERTVCWACCRTLAVQTSPNKPAEGQEIELVLNGVPYRSGDPNLPADVRVLMERIRTEGWSQEMFADWQRKTMSKPAAAAPEAAPLGQPLYGDGRLQVFKGQRISIVRLDGKLYKSDDPELTPELRDIFDYIEKEGVTPALMQHLRLYGTRVKFRPITTPTPSDGDKDFWNTAKKLWPS